MNFVFISPYFPENYEPFITRMRKKGVNVFGVGDKPYHELSQNLKDNLIEYYLVDNMEDYNQMYQAIAYLSFKHGKMDRLESNNEYWLLQDARLRTDFNIDGLKNQDMEPIKYKSKMKEVFRQCGIKVAEGRVFKDLDDALHLAEELKYPVIIKPDNGVGANDTYKIENKEALKNLYPKLKNYHYIMESFLNGVIVTYDGLLDKNGKVVYQSHYVYDTTCLDVTENHSEMMFRTNPVIPKELEKLGKKAIKKFGIKERFFHMEFFDVDGEYYGLEINCRPPGGLGFDMLNYANDIDLFQEYANIVTENTFKSKVTNKYYTYYVSRINSVSYRHDMDTIKDKYGKYMKLISRVPEAFSNILGNHAFIYKTKDLDEAYKIANDIVEKKT